MIRLSVFGEEALWQAVTSRLRGGTIECYPNHASCRLSPDEYDALLVVTADQFATAIVKQAVADGKYVLIAVPTGVPSAFLDELNAPANRLNGQLLLVNPDHFNPSRQLLRQQLESGKLGVPGLIRSHRWEAVPTKRAESQSAVPSGLVLDLELALWLMGLAPNVVYATEARPPVADRDLGRTIQVHLGFTGGPMALIGYSSALPYGDGYQLLSVMGSAGAAHADDHQNMQLLYQGQRPQAFLATEGLRPLVNLVQDFVDAIHARHDFSGSLAEWHRVWRVAQAVEQSLVSHRAISLEAS